MGWPGVVSPMCGRFSLFVPPSVLEERFDAEAARPLVPRYNVAPRDDLAAIRNDEPGTIDALEWGLLPSWVDDPDDFPRPINARAETVAEKPSFRDAFAERRCLVLADGFYEWKGERGAKQPYRIARPDDEPFAFAGLWERWGSGGGVGNGGGAGGGGEARGGDGSGSGNGDTGSTRTATIVTTEANGTVAGVHDRMPAILEPDEERRWLSADDPEELRTLLDPYPDDGLVAYPVSKAVNDPANDSPDVIEPVDVGEQSGLGDFG